MCSASWALLKVRIVLDTRSEQIIRYCQNETCDPLSRFLFVFLRDKSLHHLISINCQKRIILIDMATFV